MCAVVDEVLAGFLPALIRFHNLRFTTDLRPTDFFSYEFHHVWGGTYDECQAKMDLFFASAQFKHEVAPIAGAVEALRALKEKYALYIVTSRQLFLEEATREWINLYFPNIFTGIAFGNHYSNEGKKRSKLDMCREIGACLLIDDSAKYAKECAEGNLPVLLFGDYAWNASLILPNNIPIRSTSDSNIEQVNQEIVSDSCFQYIRRVHSWPDAIFAIEEKFSFSQNMWC